MVTLRERYMNEAVPKLREQMQAKNPMRIPHLEKVVVNMGIGVGDKDAFKAATEDLARITGQRPKVTKARQSISNFKLRQGVEIGAKVTLRGKRMYEFLERLINAALPRIRDFRGLSSESFDGRGNYTFGIKEQSIFPEIDPNNVNVAQGMDITIVTSADRDDEARELLRILGVPFAKS